MYSDYNYTHIDGYRYTETSKVPTLDPWEYIMEIWKGTTTGESQHGKLWHAATYGLNSCDKQALREDEEWESAEIVEEVVLMSIPAGQKEEITESDTRGSFSNGQTYGITFNLKNKRTGKKLVENKPPRYAFRVVWSEIKPQYIKIEVSEEEFKKYKNYPISDTWSSGPNAYFNGSTVTSPE